MTDEMYYPQSSPPPFEGYVPPPDAPPAEVPLPLQLPTEGDVRAFVSAADDNTVAAEAAARGITPRTRRNITAALAIIALACIAAEVAVTLSDRIPSEALMALASAAVGGIAGLAVPSRGD